VNVYVLVIVLTTGCGFNCNNIGLSLDVFKSADNCLEAKQRLEKNTDKKKYNFSKFECLKRGVNQ
jgi:hypothetical protein